MTAVRRWDPFSILAQLDDDFDELVRRTWGAAPSWRGAGYVPAIDMTTDGADVVIRLELPGVDRDDVDIEVHEGRLTISGERRDHFERTEAEGQGKILVRELRYGSFRREFALPEGVSADDVSADFDQGMLEVRVRNVTKPVEAPRKIAIGGQRRDGSQKTITGKVEASS